MTALEMQESFQRKFVEMSRPTIFKSYDISAFLEESQQVFVREMAKIYETDESARTYLYPITIVWEYDIPTKALPPTHKNGIKIEIPSDYYVSAKEQVESSSGTFIRIKPQKHDYYTINIDNPFKQPYDELYWRLDVGMSSDGNKYHEIITDGSLFAKYHLTYLRNPTEINVHNQTDCELHYFSHPLIVDGAITLAIASLQRAGMIQEKN